MDDPAGQAGASLASDLRCLNWLAWSAYAILCITLFFGEIRSESPFYPEPFRFYFGVLAMPAWLSAWLALLIADLARRFRWQSLAITLGTGFAMVIGYALIDRVTVVPG